MQVALDFKSCAFFASLAASCRIAGSATYSKLACQAAKQVDSKVAKHHGSDVRKATADPQVELRCVNEKRLHLEAVEGCKLMDFVRDRFLRVAACCSEPVGSRKVMLQFSKEYE